MARNAEAAPYIFNLWQKLVSSAYNASDPAASISLSFVLEVGRLVICSLNAARFSAQSSWLYPTSLPNECYSISRMNTLLQLLYILAILEAILSPVTTVAFVITIFRRETTCTHDISVFGLIAISIMVAAVVLALHALALNSSLDVQAILKTRPDLLSGDFLVAWSRFIGGKLPLVVFILFLVAGGFQIVTVSARHLIPSPKRLPKQFQPFVMKKHKGMSAVGEPEASTLGTELGAGVHSGPLARLFDDHKKRGLISAHIDLEVCQSNIAITCKRLHALHSLLTEKTYPELE